MLAYLLIVARRIVCQWRIRLWRSKCTHLPDKLLWQEIKIVLLSITRLKTDNDFFAATILPNQITDYCFSKTWSDPSFNKLSLTF